MNDTALFDTYSVSELLARLAGIDDDTSSHSKLSDSHQPPTTIKFRPVVTCQWLSDRSLSIPPICPPHHQHQHQYLDHDGDTLMLPTTSPALAPAPAPADPALQSTQRRTAARTLAEENAVLQARVSSLHGESRPCFRYNVDVLLMNCT